MNSKPIHELLDIEPGKEVEESTELTVAPVNEITLGGAVENVEEDKEDIRIQADFDSALENVKDMIELAKEATELMFDIAKDKENEKDFNALNNLIKTSVDSNDKLLGLYLKKIEYKERKRKIVAPINAEGPSTNITIDKAVFTGTLDQLGARIEEAQREMNEDE